MWHHVSSEDNPADVASRGISPCQLAAHPLWWVGPPWLAQPEATWPLSCLPSESESLPEVQSNDAGVCLAVSTTDPLVIDLFSHISHWKRIIRVVTKILLWCYAGKKSNSRPCLSDLYEQAFLCICRHIQLASFSHVYKYLHKHETLPKPLQSLAPFVDDAGLIRVAGRVPSSSPASHPILLPKNHRLVHVLIDHFHLKFAHAGPAFVQAELCKKVWIMSARQTIKARIFSCIRCFRARPKDAAPLMATLPVARIMPSPVFYHTGMDFAGPFLTKLHHLRKSPIIKSYLCIFICFSSKAVHMELAHDLSVAAFLDVLHCFISRRSAPAHLYSDNGTNFVGTAAKLNQEWQRLLSNSAEPILHSTATEGIKFHFSPPSGPHFGGLWERAVKSAKTHITRVVGSHTLTVDQLRSLFIRVEAILNSRPLTPISSDPHDLEVLTPAHFLVGRPMIAPPLVITRDGSDLVSKFNQLQSMTQHFWQRWLAEYLPSLQPHSKWTTSSPNLKLGDMVLLEEPNSPPLSWPLGRVTEVFPSADGVVRRAKATIWHCLNHYSYQNAVFLAERLCAEVQSEETVFLLATCYYRSGKPGQAYSVLRKKGSLHAQSKFLLATCCLDLGKFSEAEEIIAGSNFSKPRSFEEIVTEFSEHACFVLLLYARICTETSQIAKATEAYRKALKLNPFLWQAFEELCNTGEKPDPVRTFQISNLDNFSMCCGVNPIVNFVNNSECDGSYRIHNTNSNISSIGNDLISSTPIQVLNCYNSLASGIRVLNVDDSPLAHPLNSTYPESFTYLCSKGSATKIRSTNNSLLSPSFGVLPLDNTNESLQVAFFSPPTIVPHPILPESNDQKSLTKRMSSLRAHVGQLISRKDAPLQLSKPVFGPSGNVNNNSNIVTTQSSIAPAAPRRSSRLFSNSYSVKENNKSPNRNKFATPKSPSRKTKARMSKGNLNKTSFNELNDKNRNEKEKSETITSTEGKLIYNQNLPYQVVQVQKQSAEGLMSLLKELGLAYLHLSQYNCKKTVDYLNNISPSQLNTGWALSLMAKAKFELSEYEEAVRYFDRVRELEPYRCQYMELYSTALWHLQREVALSALAHTLLEQDRECAAAWCASGNCFSLQKEHDSAIKFFQRAIQVNPKFVYAYTLLGHEYVITEELDKALSCFRNAVRLDSRHYNAWYGIGTIYSKQERYLLAEVNYRKALAINNRSAVLLCHIGVVQHALQKSDLALETLNLAISNDPKNPLCKFHRASIYFSTGKYTEALKELEELKEIVPKESLVYYVTGKVHKKLGNTHLALMHFSWATDLDPKGTNNQIKEGIDPALSRTQAEEDMSATQADYPSDASTIIDPVVSSSQDAANL